MSRPATVASRLHLTTELAIAFERRDEAVLDWIDAAELVATVSLAHFTVRIRIILQARLQKPSVTVFALVTAFA